jgi:hypothetical protein
MGMETARLPVCYGKSGNRLASPANDQQSPAAMAQEPE